jgi:hypothetical protein
VSRKWHFSFTVYIKPIILPRQARDKHRENTPKSAVFLQGSSFNVYDKDSWDKFAMGGGAGENAFSEPFLCNTDWFTKTGSGHNNRTTAFSFSRAEAITAWQLHRRVWRAVVCQEGSAGDDWFT